MVLMLGSGCTWLGYDKPEMTLTSLSLAPSRGLHQTVNVGVKVRNPNPFALTISRVNYRIFLEGTELAFGRHDEALRIAADDSANFTFPVELNLLGGLSLAERFMRDPKNRLVYRLEVDADVANFGVGLMQIRKEAELSLAPP